MMFGLAKKYPATQSNALSDQQLRAQALDMAIRQAGSGAPVSRVAETAEAFYRFLTKQY